MAVLTQYDFGCVIFLPKENVPQEGHRNYTDSGLVICFVRHFCKFL